ncbi:MAG: hypothetical protein ACREOI_38220, partial [bacterium]
GDQAYFVGTATNGRAALDVDNTGNGHIALFRGNGNVGIGTTSPSSKLTVQSPTANTNAGYFQGNGTVGQSLGLQVDAGTNSDDFAFRVRHVLNGAEYFAVRGDGNVGIGTTSPSSKLTVQSPTANTYAGYFQGNGTVGQSLGLQVDAGTDSDDFAFRVRHVLNGTEYFAVRGDGNVGIGTTSPSTKFHFVGDQAYFVGTATNGRAALDVDNTGNGHIALFRGNGNVGIGTTNPTTKLDVEGTTTTKVLAITGGSDLAEPFEMSESQPIPKGALVIIDAENPGQLKLSHQAYDKRVAGVVSLRP